MRSTIPMFKSCECDQDELLDLAEDRLVALRDICSEMRDGCNQGCTRVQKTLSNLADQDDDSETCSSIDDTLPPPPQLSLASVGSVGGNHQTSGVPPRYSGSAGTYCLRQQQQHHQSSVPYSSPS